MYTTRAITVKLSELKKISEKLSNLIKIMNDEGACLIISDKNIKSDTSIDLMSEIENFSDFVNNFSQKSAYLNKKEFEMLHKFYTDLSMALENDIDIYETILDEIANSSHVIILHNDSILN